MASLQETDPSRNTEYVLQKLHVKYQGTIFLILRILTNEKIKRAIAYIVVMLTNVMRLLRF